MTGRKNKQSKIIQLELPFPIPECQHNSCFVTMACVPAGLVCADCGKLLFQYLPQSPDELGYMSADWAWHYKHGRSWTTL